MELEELRQQLEESSAALTRALRAEFERSREEQERRHQVSTVPFGVTLSLACCGGSESPLPPALTVCPPQMELKALKDQLEAERQAWVASCTKKEVGLDRAGCCSGLPGHSPLGITASCGGPWWIIVCCSLCTCGSRTLELEQEEVGPGTSWRPDLSFLTRSHPICILQSIPSP